MKINSLCERQFIHSLVRKQKRVDDRQLLQGRTLEIIFGKKTGSCLVLQGKSQIFTYVSCKISEPKAFTPSQGVINLNLEFSAMASPESSKTSEELVDYQRAIEHCIRDSNCIDLESLCIVSGSKVWVIRVDIHVLNDDGNVIECASIAAISALAHFRRPYVSVVGTDVTVHSVDKMEPLALNFHHMPISINLALFNEGKTIVVDPNDVEERVCNGCYVIGMNARQEICFVLRKGSLILEEHTIEQCENIAVKRAQELTQIITAALDNDAYKRATNAPIGFTHSLKNKCNHTNWLHCCDWGIDRSTTSDLFYKIFKK